MTSQLASALFVAVRYSVSTEKKEIIGIVELPHEDAALPNQDDDLLQMLWLDAKKFKLSIGCVYSIPVNAERTSYGLAYKFVQQYLADPSRSARWQLEAKAQKDAKLADQLARRDGAPVAILEKTLGPLRDAYRGMPEVQRAAFEVWLLRYLRRGY